MAKKTDLLGFVQDFIQKKLCIYHVVVRQHGEITGTFDWRDNRRDNIHSCAKSVVSMAVGIGIQEGVLSLDDKPAELFAEKLPQGPPENLLRITVRDLLSMSAGHDYFILQGYDETGRAPGRNDLPEEDWIKYVFSYPVPYRPGSFWLYNNACPFLLSAMMQERTGERLVDYLKPRLFAPLGIRNPQWEETPKGKTLGCGGLMLSCEEMSRLGEVFLTGSYQGTRLVPEAYVKEATSFQIDNAQEGGGLDENAGYGYFFWRCARDGGFRAEGWASQYILCLPEQDAVVAIASHDFEYQKILDSIWNHIVPQLKENF